jgi:hypothetical protein
MAARPYGAVDIEATPFDFHVLDYFVQQYRPVHAAHSFFCCC